MARYIVTTDEGDSYQYKVEEVEFDSVEISDGFIWLYNNDEMVALFNQKYVHSVIKK